MISQVFESLVWGVVRENNYKNFSQKMAVLGVIYALEKDSERLMMINKQYNRKYESQRISLAAYQGTLISWTWREVNGENQAQYIFMRISALQKAEFSSQAGLICQSQGPDWERLCYQDLGWVHLHWCTWKSCISISPWILWVHKNSLLFHVEGSPPTCLKTTNRTIPPKAKHCPFRFCLHASGLTGQ